MADPFLHLSLAAIGVAIALVTGTIREMLAERRRRQLDEQKHRPQRRPAHRVIASGRSDGNRPTRPRSIP